MKIRALLESERPRERLWAQGSGGLKTSELIAILLRTGLKGKSAIVLGQEMLKRGAEMLQIELLDHMILGVPSEFQPEAYYSFREGGYL